MKGYWSKDYQLNDINIALELIMTLPEIIMPGESFQKNTRNAQAYRVFGEGERYKLTLEAQGFLYDAIYAGLLTGEEIEHILNSVLQIENIPQIGIGELKAIINNIVADTGRLMLIYSMKRENQDNTELN